MDDTFAAAEDDHAVNQPFLEEQDDQLVDYELSPMDMHTLESFGEHEIELPQVNAESPVYLFTPVEMDQWLTILMGYESSDSVSSEDTLLLPSDSDAACDMDAQTEELHASDDDDSDDDDDMPDQGSSRLLTQGDIRTDEGARKEVQTPPQAESSWVATSTRGEHMLPPPIDQDMRSLLMQCTTQLGHSTVSQQTVVSSSHGVLPQLVPIPQLEVGGTDIVRQLPPPTTSLVHSSSLGPLVPNVNLSLARIQVQTTFAGGFSSPAGTTVVSSAFVAGSQGSEGNPINTLWFSVYESKAALVDLGFLLFAASKCRITAVFPTLISIPLSADFLWGRAYVSIYTVCLLSVDSLHRCGLVRLQRFGLRCLVSAIAVVGFDRSSSSLGDPDPTMVVEDVGSDDDSVKEDLSSHAVLRKEESTRKSVFDRLSVDNRLKLGPNDQVQKTFADAVGPKGVTQASLDFFPLADKTKCQVKIPLDLAKRASVSFITTVCGYFLGPRLQFAMVKRFAKTQWGKFGFVDAMLNESGIFFFKFETVGGAAQVAELGSVMISGVPFFLIPWDPTKGLSKPQHTSCPLWVKIHNIPLIAFNKEGISRIASALGVPKLMDACTTSMCDKAWGRPGFAKLLIDVWAVGELKKEVEIVIPSLTGGEDLKSCLRVEYLWEPIQCSHCLVFGHRTTNCAKAATLKKEKGKAQLLDDDGFQKVVKKKWVPKKPDGATTSVDGPSSSGPSSHEPSEPSEPLETNVITPSVSGLQGQPILESDVALENSPKTDMVQTVAVDPLSEGKVNSLPTPEASSNVCFTRGTPDPNFKKAVVNTVKSYTARRGVFVAAKSGVTVEKNKPNAFSALATLEDTEGTTRGKVNRVGLDQKRKETHVRKDVLNRVATDVFGNWRWSSNVLNTETGTRILVAWDEGVLDVMVVDSHAQFLHCFVKLRGLDKAFFITIVYGSNLMTDRKELWSGLRKARVLMGDKPWVVLGDFNSILFPHDGYGGSSRRNPSMEDFYLCVEDVELLDINYSGIHYTWVQKPKGGEGLLRKLDRIMSNTMFLSLFQGSSVVFMNRGLSDHACGILELPITFRKKPRGFKFDNFITDNPAFLDIVAQEWEFPVYGSFMHRLLCHLKRLKQPLRKLRNLVGDVSLRVNKLRTELDAIHLAYDLDPSNPVLMEDLAHISLAYERARNDELLFLKQRAKVRWLHDGDKNSKFFHQVVKERRSRSLIRSVLDSQGRYVYDEAVGDLFVDHFRSFLGMCDPLVEPTIPNDFFRKSLTLSESLHMIRPIMDDEIKWAVFNIGNDKAPGSDGFTSKFFKAAWNIVGKDVQVAVHNFFYSGKLLKELNHTLLCFIPKVPNASRVTDFRPISCCNVLYKVISKIIAERMKPFLSQLIGPDQSAFIPGRRISDNILMAHELVAGYQRSSGQPRCAFKIDLRKAYDTVDWRFLLRMLQGFGFHPVFCNWIDQMLNTSSFSIALNGETFGFFKGARGLRQGDPISPYLFTIVMECFSMILRQCIEEESGFTYHQGCDDLSITHLCFADDLFIFSGGNLASVEIVKRALDRFRRISGLEPNLSKSEVFFSNVDDDIKAAILGFMPLNAGVFPIRYLGVPLSPVCLRVSDFAPLINKVKYRIHDWKSKFLSFGGRKQLIVSVLQSMQLYWLMIYLLPSAVVHELESCFRDFLWSQGEASRGKCKISWDTICGPISSGGLGFKRLGLWNRAFLAKHIWELLTHRNSLWVNWIWRHCIRQHSFWTLKPNQKWSWIFRRILDIRVSVRHFFRYQVGSGEGVNAWADTWLEEGPLSCIISYRRFTSVGFDSETSVRNLLDTCNGVWPEAWVTISPNTFSQPPPLATDNVDVLQWRGRGGQGVQFSIKDAWQSLSGAHQPLNWTKFVWFKGHVPKLGFCMWTACHGRLPTQDRIGAWMHDTSTLCCPLCDTIPDSHDHLFFDCSYSREVWRRLKRLVGLHGFPEVWSVIMEYLNDNRGPRRMSHRLALSGAVYFIWRERNRRLFQSLKQPPIVVFKQVRDLITAKEAVWKRGKKT
ncbi:hypothetical protein OSB04_un000289 [Centaurea solstitialis]|uniref:Reverse transcriptase domain-containing protein n=1 Tax=Centaurea solstitialis TaxID=347529 RepID=A0AA38VVN5_9ASTR|nr:hypothetical protein OSB04_un000289 [Centaurea solstitialis]